MAIEYVKVKRTITVGRNPGEKFQARIKRGQTIDEKDLCDEITESTTLARGEVKLVVEQLQYHIVKHAKNGESVQLKELGIFYPSISAKAVDSVDDVTSETITRKCIRYRQNVEVRKAMDNSHTKLANMEIKGLQSQYSSLILKQPSRRRSTKSKVDRLHCSCCEAFVRVTGKGHLLKKLYICRMIDEIEL